MQFSRNKTIAIISILLLVVTLGASISLMPSANAHTPLWQIPTHAYIQVNPNPVGVGQQVTVYMWLDQVFGAGFETTAYAAINNNYRFHNYNLTIVAPNGNTTTQIFETVQDTTSSQYVLYTPDQLGIYKFYFSFPGQDYVNPFGYNPNSVLVNDTYLPSSASTTLTVQQEPIPAPIFSYPLPKEYWTRPIYGENTDWWTISSNWRGEGSPVLPATGSGVITAYSGGALLNRYPGDAIGPLTSHVMWTKPVQSGGVAGGNTFQIQGNQYFEGSAYNQRYVNPIVLNGKIYYTETISFTGASSGPTDCVDLRTGQVLWSRTDVPLLSFGMVWDHEDPNQHGVYPAILWTSNYARAFDADTGAQLFNVTAVPSGYDALGPWAETLRYVMVNLGNSSTPNWVLAEWNSTKLWNYAFNPYTTGSLLSPSIINITAPGFPQYQNLITTFPIPITGTTGTLSNSTPTSTTTVVVPYGSNLVVNGGVLNSSDPQNRYDWNYSINSWHNTMPATGVFAPTILAAYPGDMLLLRNGSYSAPPQSFAAFSWTPWTYFAVNLNASRGTIGDVLWWNTINPPAGNLTVTYGGSDPTANGGTGVFVEGYKETMQWVGYNLRTGQQLWGPVGNQSSFDYYGNPIFPFLDSQLAYGKLYSSAYGGILYCYDLTNGNLLWTYGNDGQGNTTKAGFNVPYGDYPTFINAVGNGILYLVTSEHTVETPIYKGALQRAVNATDGTEIWTISGDTNEFRAMSYAIADGYATWFNGYDNQIYSVGRGPSATTVSAPSAGFGLGGSLVISGKVTDISAGIKQNDQAARFPNGVSVASDASMADWMGYIYQQKPLPSNFTGVDVAIVVLDSNGNYRQVGTATTDSSGSFSLQYKPDITGKYTVFASFAGTKGYWPSTAQASFAVDAAAATPAPTAAPPQSLADMYIIPGIIAIIVVIIIIGALIMLMLRRRP